MGSQDRLERLRAAVSLDDARGVEAMGTWFLGPVAESEALLARLVARAVDDHSVVRRVVYPDDPPWIDTSTPAYDRGAKRLERELLVMMRRLSRYSIPWYSYRYQAHMNWDNALPAVVGYFGAMLYNQNNVAAEGSPVTTALEIAVARDLCRMLGFPTATRAPDAPEASENPEPWGHITCDGSVANIEALWAARNLKLYPFAVQYALQNEEKLEQFQHLEVSVTGGGPTRLVDLDGWQILNLVTGEALAIPERLKDLGAEKAELETINRHSVQHLGLGRFAERFDRTHGRGTDGDAGASGSMVHDLAVVAPASCHYSMPKAATLLGLGTDQLIEVEIDVHGRMDLGALTALLEERGRKRLPVAAVVAVIGSTQESAVDPLAGILEARRRCREHHGFDFAIHADAAWGGYFAALLRHPHPESAAARTLAVHGTAVGEALGETRAEGVDPGAALAHNQLAAVRLEPRVRDVSPHEAFVFTPEMGMNRHARKHLEAMAEADTITIDPHKAGFVPYPAGALCYRDRRMPEMIQFTAPVVYHGGDAQTVGVFGVEGSKPGAAAAAVWLSHRIIRPDQSGYGRILGRCIFNAKRLFGALAAMESDFFVIAMLQELDPDDRAELEALVPLTNQAFWQALRDDPGKAELFREKGPDLLINTYAVNPKIDGTKNPDPAIANALNDRVYRRLSLDAEGDEWPAVVVTGSEYDPGVAGQAFVDRFRRRLGIDPSPATMNYLLSTTANPWLSDAGGGEVNMVPVVVEHLKSVIEDEAKKLADELTKARS